MPWSTKRTRNSGPSRHILRLILLVIFAWVLLYNIRYTNGPDAKSLRRLLRAEYDAKHQAEHPQSPDGEPNSLPPPQPPVGIVVGGPQIGAARFDIHVPAPDSDIPLPPRPQSPPPPAVNKQHPPSSSPPWLKTHYTSPASPASPAVSHLVLSPSSPLFPATTPDDEDNASSSGAASVLILVMTRDSHSWGRQDGLLRSFRDFLSMLAASTGVSLRECALGVLTSDKGEWVAYEEVLDEMALEEREKGMGKDEGEEGGENGDRAKVFGGGVHLVYHSGYLDGGQGGGWVGGDAAAGAWGRMLRHEDDIQHARRAEMAKLRNYLMVSALGSVGKAAGEVVWFDADIYEVSDGLLGDMRRGMREGGAEVGVVTSVSWLGNRDYDLNAWRGRRTRPSEEEWEAMKSGEREGNGMGTWVAHMADGATLGDLVKIAEVEKATLEQASEWVWEGLKKEALEGERRDADLEGEERRKVEDEREAEVERWVKDVGEEMGRKLVEVEGGGGKVVGDLVTEGDGPETKRLVKREDSVFDPSKAEFEDGEQDEDDGDDVAGDALSTSAEQQDDDSSKDGESKSSLAADAFDLPDFVRLDAVGATVLMLRADLVKQGLLFATSYLVGTDWESEGWDGIESEGLCITARTLGSGCWGIKKGFTRHVAG